MYRPPSVGQPVHVLAFGSVLGLFASAAGCNLEQGGLGAADPVSLQPDAAFRRPGTSYPPPPARPAPAAEQPPRADPLPMDPLPGNPLPPADASAGDNGARAATDDGGVPPADGAAAVLPPSGALPTAATPADFCAGNALLLCLPFDGNASDLGPARRETDATGVTFESGRRGQAARFGPGREVQVRQSFPVPERILTVELQVRPAAYPANGRRAGLVHSPDQYGVFLQDNDGDLECRTSSASAVARRAIPLNGWTRVMCIFDEEDVEVYINGRPAGNGRSFQRLPVRVNMGVRIGTTDLDGGPLLGLIDEVRVWRGRRTP